MYLKLIHLPPMTTCLQWYTIYELLSCDYNYLPLLPIIKSLYLYARHFESYLLVLVSAFSLVGLNRLPPEQVMLLIEEDTLGFDWGKCPKSYLEKCPVCCRFSTDALTEQPKAAGCRNRYLLDFHQSPFSRVVALIPLGARPIHLGWPYQEPKFPTA